MINTRVNELIVCLKPYKAKKIILFGSGVSGQFKRGSDMDVLIIKDTRDSFWERQKKIASLLKTNFEVDAFVLTSSELQDALSKTQPFIYDVIHNGKVIYEQA